MHGEVEGAQRVVTLDADLTGAVLNGRVMVGERTVQMHAEHGAVLGPPGVRAVPRPRAMPRSTIPGDLKSLLGRDDEVRAVQGLLGSGSPVEIVGEAGIGKTTLLCHLADRQADPGEMGNVLFLRAARQPGEDILQFLFDSFYECDTATVPTAAELERYLGDRRGLVVLDDADLARRELERVMSFAPGCVFAIGAGERRFLGGAQSVTLGGLDAQSCFALAERELRRALTEHERASLSRLVPALDGHPLRILQAAHLMIEGQRPRSQRSAPTGSPTHQFDELVALSLDGDEERVLGPLVALPKIALEAWRLAAISGISDARRLLFSLEERGFVQAHDRSYSLAGTASAALGPRVDSAAWQDRALEHYCRTEEAVSAAEAPAILALLDAGARAGNQEAVIQLARNANAPLALGTRWGAWREALDHALVAARGLRDRRAEAWALHQLGSRAVCLGDLDGGTALLKDALSLGDGEGARLTRHNLDALGGGLPAPSALPPSPSPPPWSPPAPPPPAPSPPAPSAPPSTPEIESPRQPPAPAAPPRAAAPAPARPRIAKRTPRKWPPLKPVAAVVAAVVLVLVVVLAVSGGDEDPPAPSGKTEKAKQPAPQPKDRTDRRAAPGSRQPQPLPPIIQPKVLRFRAPLDRLSKPLSVRAENKGAARITLGKVRVEGTDRGDFFATDGCNRSTLSRGETCKVVLSFVPGRRQGANMRTRTAVLIFGNDGTGGEQKVSLRGSVATP